MHYLLETFRNRAFIGCQGLGGSTGEEVQSNQAVFILTFSSMQTASPEKGGAG